MLGNSSGGFLDKNCTGWEGMDGMGSTPVEDYPHWWAYFQLWQRNSLAHLFLVLRELSAENLIAIERASSSEENWPTLGKTVLNIFCDLSLQIRHWSKSLVPLKLSFCFCITLCSEDRQGIWPYLRVKGVGVGVCGCGRARTHTAIYKVEDKRLLQFSYSGNGGKTGEISKDHTFPDLSRQNILIYPWSALFFGISSQL